jgi:hypothetical protein
MIVGSVLMGPDSFLKKLKRVKYLLSKFEIHFPKQKEKFKE